jgi:hypothetical protein
VDRTPLTASALTRLQRVLLVLLGGGLLASLSLAALLKPDARGYGTHQALGLPPCTFYYVTGRRCPSCGMTTSWAYLVRGQMWHSFRANVGGSLLGMAALVLAPWALVSGLRGRWLCGGLDERWLVGLLWAIMVITLLDWGVRLLGGW